MKIPLLLSLVLCSAASAFQPPPPPGCGQNGVICTPTPVPPYAQYSWLAPQSCDMWKGTPPFMANMQCPAGQIATRVSQPSYPALQFCPTVIWGVCEPAPIPGQIYPTYMISHVIYTVPGSQSTVSYQAGSSSGTSVSIDSDSKTSTQIKAGISGGVPLIASVSASVQADSSNDSTQSSSLDLTTTELSSYSVPGRGDGIDHDWDEIWIVAGPVINMLVNPAQPWPSNAPASLTWQLGGNDNTEYFFVYAGELSGGFKMPSGVAAELARYGIGPADYPKMLKADPFFINGVKQPQNMALDPKRYKLVKQFVYEPPGGPFTGPGGGTAKQTYSISRGQTTTSTDKESQSNDVGYTVGGSAGFLGFMQASFSFGTTWAWTYSTTNKLTNTSTTQDTLVLAQPSRGYKGPPIVRAYEDTLWHTYVFEQGY